MQPSAVGIVPGCRRCTSRWRISNVEEAINFGKQAPDPKTKKCELVIQKRDMACGSAIIMPEASTDAMEKGEFLLGEIADGRFGDERRSLWKNNTAAIKEKVRRVLP